MMKCAKRYEVEVLVYVQQWWVKKSDWINESQTNSVTLMTWYIKEQICITVIF